MNCKSGTIILLCIAVLGSPAFAEPARPAHAAVEVLGKYKAALESLDGTKTLSLFAADAQVVENGKREGTFANYLAHHLGPELAEFRSFKFFDYKVDVRTEGPLAIATESYTFRIEPKQGDAVERQGVTTSVLKPVGNGWKIVSMHSSSRPTRR